MLQSADVSYKILSPGDPMPRVVLRAQSQPTFAVDSAAGRYLVLCFYGSTADERGRHAIEAMERHRTFFDGRRAWVFGVSVDPTDEARDRVRDKLPGTTFLWDFAGSTSRDFGILPQQDEGVRPEYFRPTWVVVDPTLHILAIFPFEEHPSRHDALFEFLEGLPPPDRFAGFELPIPVLVLPSVFEPALCRHLIDLYDRHGGGESGIHRNDSGVMDFSFKRRKDFIITDDNLIRNIQIKIHRRVVPEIERLFFMKITRMERYIVGCYAAEDGGHFRPHRDNGPGATAHRRFAVSVNLNGDFEGGEVHFPEYSSRGIKAPPGWAVIFPCAILHQVARVRSGRRYAFLPFVYDEAGAHIRNAFFASLQPPLNGDAATVETAEAVPAMP